MKYKFLYFFISGIFLVSGIFSIVKNGFVYGVEFTGGSSFDFKLTKAINQDEKLKSQLEEVVKIFSIQKTSDGLLVKTGNVDKDAQTKVESIVTGLSEGDAKLTKFEQVGPTLSRELIEKTVVGILLATMIILFWIAYQFKSILFGLSATLATIHDATILIGAFSIFGKLYGVEVDFLFVTAVLTTLSFSVHDTIVVYDRIREIKKKHGGSLEEVANKALSETMKRSLYNSFTIVIMLLCLVLIGGSSTRWFAAALLVGTVSGTYSSPFVAVPALTTIEKILKNFKKNSKKQ